MAVFVVLGVGIYYHANIWPDHQTIWNGDWTNWRIWTIIYYPYWQLYAELNLESLDGNLFISFLCLVHDCVLIVILTSIIFFFKLTNEKKKPKAQMIFSDQVFPSRCRRLLTFLTFP